MPSALQRRKVVPQKSLPLGPWRGVRDVGDAGMQDPAFLQDAINCWFQDSDNGGSVFARPGAALMTASGLESNSRIQALFSMEVGTSLHLFAFVNGKVYRHSTGTTWTDVSPAGITINASVTRIHVLPYNGEMIVNDGLNEPWRGTSLGSSPIIGTEIEINTAGAAWIARGVPTVHGGKLFFIVDDIAGTKYYQRIAWSEEASAATGYLQDGFTNSWDLIQSSEPREAILAIQGTNNGLHFFRNLSIGVISGAVNDDFATDSTNDGISTDVGIGSFANNFVAPLHLLAGNHIWFLDNAYRLCRIRLGSREIQPIWKQLRNRMQRTRGFTTNATVMQNWLLAYSPDLDKVAGIILPDDNDSGASSSHLYIFDATTGNYEGRWIIAQATQPTTEVGTTEIATIGLGKPVNAEGAPFVFGTSTGNVWLQHAVRQYGNTSLSLGDNGAAMHQSVTMMLAPESDNVEFRVDELAAAIVPDTAIVNLDYYTPRASTAALQATGLATTDSISSSHDHGRAVWGLNAIGRWFRAVLHWNVPSGSTQYGFERASLKTRGFPASPRVK